LPYFFAIRDGDRVRIEGADARHLARSLRARAGERIAVVEPQGRLLTVQLDSVTSQVVQGHVVAEQPHDPEPRRRVVLAAAMLPAAALEAVLSRGTELGASGFVVVHAERSVARGAKPERWATICREAAMLAGRLRVPEVEGPLSLGQAWARARQPFLLDRTGERQLSEVASAEELTLFVGPEGGWTAEELAQAGDRVLSLGPRNLRADTAALAALSVALL
jgi:16S rRNA (uracil1498-N3)-methyltransferase